MAGSAKVLRLGVIAEERNDVEVIEALAGKVIGDSRFATYSFIGHGCGKLRVKCDSWAKNLVDRGCQCIVIVHDLDHHNEKDLLVQLHGKLCDVRAPHKLVLIPIREIEAWLLSDPLAIQKVFRMRTAPRVVANPQTLTDPKAYLSQLVHRTSKSRYLNTVHNSRIARAMTLQALHKCASFSRFPPFLRDALN